MDKDLHLVYGRLFNAYGLQPVFPFGWEPGIGLLRVTDMISRTVEKLELRQRIRSDVLYFLALNLGEMIARPLALIDHPSLKDLGTIIEADVRTILNDAKRQTDGEISARRVLQSVAATWNKLKVNDLKVWGRENE